MKTIRDIAVVTGLCLVSASVASAQAPAAAQTTPSPLNNKLFVNVNVGGQTQARVINTNFTVPNIYGETAALAATATVDGGPLFDFSIGYRFMPRIGVSIGYSRYNKAGSVFGAASVPNPVFFNQPAAVTITPRPAAHSEKSVYALVSFFVPIDEKLEFSLFAGPSGTRVTQELINGFTIPAGTQSILSTIGGESGTAMGVNAGADLAITLYPHVAVGGFARYNGGKVDLPSAPDLKVGGFQAGGGVRLKF